MCCVVIVTDTAMLLAGGWRPGLVVVLILAAFVIFMFVVLILAGFVPCVRPQGPHVRPRGACWWGEYNATELRSPLSPRRSMLSQECIRDAETTAALQAQMTCNEAPWRSCHL